MSVFVKWISGEVDVVDAGETSSIAYEISRRKGLCGMNVKLFSEQGEELSNRCIARDGEQLYILVEPDSRKEICRKRNRIIESIQDDTYGPVVYWIREIGEEYEIHLLSLRIGRWSYSNVIGDDKFLKKVLETYEKV